ncbi:uncharacterized protein AMSG_00866 [Thecamonas trahens ATCC 50062]|uniref:Uncharacterized protein n=1 Tax=Thecamonas trahens ATCC 50062 TaxID=461836 RepID=A0A0L0DEF0_THETB|nr:hypothetical protein AMSG_00866 [Thecamonas trahens ATCC 50062]KNC50707.1 hypothetical protein AMSG_00866 [Thecamonas trahens ATCC 50062]|eukprot:XP_013762584.1 hypothetical protein AMSG_00866 [Thecamonas trahens ATCC 50062]
MQTRTWVVLLATAVILLASFTRVNAQSDDDEDYDIDEDLFELEADNGDVGAGDVVDEAPLLDGLCGCGGDPVMSAEDLCSADLVEARENTPLTTQLWQTISSDDMDGFCRFCGTTLHWAYEFGRAEMVQILACVGADQELEDASGKIPARLRPRGFKVDL